MRSMTVSWARSCVLVAFIVLAVPNVPIGPDGVGVDRFIEVWDFNIDDGRCEGVTDREFRCGDGFFVGAILADQEQQ